MNTKKIIITLGIIAIVLVGIILIINVMRRDTNPPTTSIDPTTPPTGVIIPTRDIAQGGFDIVSIDPKDQVENVPINQTITISFSREFQDNEIEFHINPSTPHRATRYGNKLIIFPQTTWNTGTPYAYSVIFAEDREKVRLYGFTTAGPTPEYLPDTQPEGEFERQQADLKENYTDYYVNNNIPYETASFSVVSEFNPNPPEHFYFIVTSKVPNQEQARADFNLWLQSIDLSDEQIGKLDIQYR